MESIVQTGADPTSLLPEEPMVYEIKKKKKKKKKDREDPFKDVKETKYCTTIVVEPCSETDPFEADVKVEDIEVSLDCNQFLEHHMLTDTSQEATNYEDNPNYIPENDMGVHQMSFESIFPQNGEENFLPALMPSPTFICDVCNLVFSNENTLKIHKIRVHNEKNDLKFKCDYCNMAYAKKPSLIVHVKRKHSKNSTPEDKEERSCEICSLAFVGAARLRMHMQRKHGSFTDDFQHECQFCGLTYEKASSLTVHVQRKHTEKQLVPELFTCPFCPKLFTLKQSLMTHVKRKHKAGFIESAASGVDTLLNSNLTNYGDYICSMCPLTFKNISMLKVHLQRTHDACKEIFKLKCSICDLSFEKKTSLVRHIKRKHDKNAYCNTCHKQFDSYDLYLNHSHQKEIWDCPECGTIFPTKRTYDQHLMSAHNIEIPNQILCDQCSHGFSTKKLLRAHIVKVHTKCSYACVQCDKYFKSKDSLRQHVVRKHTPKEMQLTRACHHCNKRFKNERELCNHVVSVHTNEGMADVKMEENEAESAYHCLKCSESYPTWALLNTHNKNEHAKIDHSEHCDDNIKVRKNKQKVECTMCGLFLPVDLMSKHLKSHTDVFKCQYCDFEANETAALTKHLLRHKDIEVLKCNYDNCGYSTFNMFILEKHKLKHSNDVVKYHCSQCTFQSTNKYTLKYHEKEHYVGKKLYKCKDCEYTTITAANLVQHKYKHLPDKKFKCDVCPFASKYNTSLRFHIKKKHRDLPVTNTVN